MVSVAKMSKPAMATKTEIDDAHRDSEGAAAPQELGTSERGARAVEQERLSAGGITLRDAAKEAIWNEYGHDGPRGVRLVDLVGRVNVRLLAEKKSKVGDRTVRRARNELYPWWRGGGQKSQS